MRLLILTILTSVFFTGCASFEKWQAFKDEQVEEKVSEAEKVETDKQVESKVATETPVVTQVSAPMTPAQASIKFQQDYRGQLLSNMGTMQQNPNKNRYTKNINYYVRGLMHELVGNMQYVNASTPMAVTSFVFLDSDYQYSDLIGRQMAESFMHEVHKFGIPVIDFKTTDYVRVGPGGDFILSKDYLELSGDLPIKYVVAGTMVKHLAGYLVNARIVGIESKAVVASAQGFLPASVINSLISSNLNDGIPVTAGN